MCIRDRHGRVPDHWAAWWGFRYLVDSLAAQDQTKIKIVQDTWRPIQERFFVQAEAAAVQVERMQLHDAQTLLRALLKSMSDTIRSTLLEFNHTMLEEHTASGGNALPLLPGSFDWRDVNGTSFVGPVRNHHLPVGTACASCWAVTTASVVASRINIHTGANLQLSAQYLLNCLPGQDHCGYPGSSSAAMKYVAVHGIPVESLSLIHISEPTRLLSISYAVFCLKKKKQKDKQERNTGHTEIK
eukprot:TRINITY_DN27876_c0_g2_i1.p1 TRINITY_DN27876_c0_g2~~TRINITY_DN27876_c0_g2_i1.p1  ORF type:complete len:243 (+),score=42.58 TRINITY_DN27876_c0_g2_i1:78-806(+)